MRAGTVLQVDFANYAMFGTLRLLFPRVDNEVRVSIYKSVNKACKVGIQE
jgi:hypothetical protein